MFVSISDYANTETWFTTHIKKLDSTVKNINLLLQRCSGRGELFNVGFATLYKYLMVVFTTVSPLM